jgi:hypothetical protein
MISRAGKKPEFDPSAELPRIYDRAELEGYSHCVALSQPSRPRVELDDTSLSKQRTIQE